MSLDFSPVYNDQCRDFEESDEDESPMNFSYGYKKVYVTNNDGTVSEAVATLRIPNNADVRTNPSDYCSDKKRTNKAWVESIIIVPNTASSAQIWNINPSPAVNNSVNKAHSHSRENFIYKRHKWVFSNISDDQSQHQWLEGIHYHQTFNAAKYFNPRNFM